MSSSLTFWQTVCSHGRDEVSSYRADKGVGLPIFAEVRQVPGKNRNKLNCNLMRRLTYERICNQDKIRREFSWHESAARGSQIATGRKEPRAPVVGREHLARQF